MRIAIPAVFLALLATGCGTIRHGRYQTIPLSTNPAGAAVDVRCGNSPAVKLLTPTTISVSRRAMPCEVHLSKEGFEDRVLSLDRRVSRNFWMNLLWMPSLAIGGYAGGEDECAGFLCTTREEDAFGFFVLGIVPAGIGMGVDAISGAMYERPPVPAETQLTPK